MAKTKNTKTTDSNIYKKDISNVNANTVSSAGTYNSYLPTNARSLTLEFAGVKAYSPATVNGIIISTNYYSKWILYNTMEICIPRLLKNMAYLKDQVSSRKFKLKPYDDSPEAMEVYDIIKKAVANMKGEFNSNLTGFNQFTEDCIDAYGKGICVQEIVYEEKDGLILPKGAFYISPLNYIVTDRITFNNFTEEQVKDKFVIAMYKNRASTNCYSYGVYQSLAWWININVYVREWFVKLCEVYGFPFRIGKLPPAADKTMRDNMATQLANLGASGWGVMPNGAEISLVQGQTSSDQNLHLQFLKYTDQMVDQIMLGQNLTSEAKGGSYAAAQVHERKESNIVDSLAKFVADVLNTQFIEYVLNVNGIITDKKPIFEIEIEKDFDLLSKKIDIYNKLQSLGYELSMDPFIAEMKHYNILVEKQNDTQTTDRSNGGKGPDVGKSDPKDSK